MATYNGGRRRPLQSAAPSSPILGASRQFVHGRRDVLNCETLLARLRGSQDGDAQERKHRADVTASELRELTHYAARDLSPEAYATWESALHAQLFALVHSAAPREAYGGIVAVAALVSAPAAEPEMRAIKFANALSHVLRASTEVATLTAAAAGECAALLRWSAAAAPTPPDTPPETNAPTPPPPPPLTPPLLFPPQPSASSSSAPLPPSWTWSSSSFSGPSSGC